MAAVHDLPGQLSVRLDTSANAEKRGLGTVFVEHFEHLRRDCQLRTIVDAECDLTAERSVRRQARHVVPRIAR